VAREQPRYLTLFDLIWQVTFVTAISTGCYLGWRAEGTAVALYAGGLGGWAALVVLTVAARAALGLGGRADDFREPR
jgi:hypothetical protein